MPKPSDKLIETLTKATGPAEGAIKKELKGCKIFKDGADSAGLADDSDEGAETETALDAAIKLLGIVKSHVPAAQHGEVMKLLSGQSGMSYPVEAEAQKMGYSKTPPPASGGQKEEAITKEDIAKIEDPKLKGQLERLWTANEEAIKKEANATKILKEATEREQTRIFKEKAAVFTKLPVKQEELAKILKTATEKAPEIVEELERVLKAADTAMGGTFEELGSSRRDGGGAPADKGGQDLPASPTYEKIMKGAQEVKVLKEKGGAVVSIEQARADFMRTDEGAKLYAQYEEEQAAANRAR